MHRRHLIGLAAAAALAPAARAESVMGPDGLYTNPMFRDTFLDMAEDHAEAAAEAIQYYQGADELFNRGGLANPGR